MRSVSHPDGTLDLYYYEYSAPGQLNTTVLSGQPNGDQTDVVDGTETIYHWLDIKWFYEGTGNRHNNPAITWLHIH